MNNKYKADIMCNSIFHVQNLMEVDDDAKCIEAEEAYKLCEQLEAKDKRIAELEEAANDFMADTSRFYGVDLENMIGGDTRRSLKRLLNAVRGR